jgi:hypothetical protein
MSAESAAGMAAVFEISTPERLATQAVEQLIDVCLEGQPPSDLDADGTAIGQTVTWAHRPAEGDLQLLFACRTIYKDGRVAYGIIDRRPRLHTTIAWYEGDAFPEATYIDWLKEPLDEPPPLRETLAAYVVMLRSGEPFDRATQEIVGNRVVYKAAYQHSIQELVGAAVEK